VSLESVIQEDPLKAIRVHKFGTPEVMKLEVVEDPKPGPGQVVVKVRAIGVNPVDTYIRSGLYTIKPALPYTPGIDAAGVVDAVGEGVSRLSAGDRVYVAGTLSGAYAEITLCEDSQVHPLPEGVTFAQGASIGIPYAAAYRALFNRARAEPGEVLLVHGASGGVGIAATQLALAAGMHVIGTSSTERGMALVAAQGADHVFDHNDPGHLSKIMELTGGNGVDVILEMLANVNMGRDLGILARNGRVVVVGSRGPVELDPREIMKRDAAILGMVLMNADACEIYSIHAALAAGLKYGTLSPVIGREIHLSETALAHYQIMEPGTYGKIILVP
jgi:NADPH2:quinone reductase